MIDERLRLSPGGFVEGNNGQLLMGAFFYHPDTGVGYAGEDGTFRRSYYSSHTNRMYGVIVHFYDMDDIDPIRVEAGEGCYGTVNFPMGIEYAIGEAIRRTGIRISEPEVL